MIIQGVSASHGQVQANGGRLPLPDAQQKRVNWQQAMASYHQLQTPVSAISEAEQAAGLYKEPISLAGIMSALPLLIDTKSGVGLSICCDLLNQEPGDEICKLHELTCPLVVILEAAWQCQVC